MFDTSQLTHFLVQDISTLLQEYTFDFAQYLEVKEVWLGFLITLSVLAAIYVLLLIFFIKRIRIATRLLAEASKVRIYNMKHIMCCI